MNRRLKYVPMLCVCLIGMLVSCGTVKRASGLSGNKAVVEEKDPLTLEQRRKYDYFFLEALRMKEKGDLDAAFEMYSHCLPPVMRTFVPRRKFTSSGHSLYLRLKHRQTTARSQSHKCLKTHSWGGLNFAG